MLNTKAGRSGRLEGSDLSQAFGLWKRDEEADGRCGGGGESNLDQTWIRWLHWLLCGTPKALPQTELCAEQLRELLEEQAKKGSNAMTASEILSAWTKQREEAVSVVSVSASGSSPVSSLSSRSSPSSASGQSSSSSVFASSVFPSPKAVGEASRMDALSHARKLCEIVGKSRQSSGKEKAVAAEMMKRVGDRASEVAKAIPPAKAQTTAAKIPSPSPPSASCADVDVASGGKEDGSNCNRKGPSSRGPKKRKEATAVAGGLVGLGRKCDHENLVMYERSHFTAKLCDQDHYPDKCVDCQWSLRPGKGEGFCVIKGIFNVKCCTNAVNDCQHSCVFALCHSCYSCRIPPTRNSPNKKQRCSSRSSGRAKQGMGKLQPRVLQK